MKLEFLVSIATIVEGFGSLGILLFTLYQVYCMRKELKQANVQTCFSIELEIYEARRRFEDASAAVLKWRNEVAELPKKKQKSDKVQNKTRVLSLEYNTAKEAYFSEIDRLCSYLVSRKLDEKDFREDWGSLIGELVDGNKDEFRDKYVNILKLNKKWGDGY